MEAEGFREKDFRTEPTFFGAGASERPQFGGTRVEHFSWQGKLQSDRGERQKERKKERGKL